jgi:ABC-type multidrug transport system ATPase subunit
MSSAPAPARRAAPSAPVTGLDLRDVTKTWPGAPRPVLDRVRFGVARGEVVYVAGANGAGKTTLLRIAAGMIDADAGTVTLDGLDVHDDRRAYARRLGFLSAGGGLYARLSVFEHLRWAARIALIPRERRAAAMAAALDFWRLRELAARRVDRLSMGQRHRVRLALTFMPGPALILLDEPLTSLDDEGAELLGTAVALQRSRGGSVVWSAPGGETPAEADRALVVADGGLHPA